MAIPKTTILLFGSRNVAASKVSLKAEVRKVPSRKIILFEAENSSIDEAGTMHNHSNIPLLSFSSTKFVLGKVPFNLKPKEGNFWISSDSLE